MKDFKDFFAIIIMGFVRSRQNRNNHLSAIERKKLKHDSLVNRLHKSLERKEYFDKILGDNLSSLEQIRIRISL